MALTALELVTHPRFYECIREQSRMLLGMAAQNARHASVFSTQQRWLLAHLGLSLYFERTAANPAGGLINARFLELVREYDIASRNTADSFMKEMIHYKAIRYVSDIKGKRMRPLEPSEVTLAAVGGWLAIHLSVLDRLDGGGRTAAFGADPERLLARVQPRIARGLLSSKAVREPEDTFSLFTWLNNGGIVMDSLIAGISETDPEADQVPTDVQSVADLAGRLMLSRTHLTRKLRSAEAMGSIGWTGRRGQSIMWVSRGFRQEYANAQAIKLAIIGEAFEAITGIDTPLSAALERAAG
ncbi:MAG: hypothetical protein BGN83_11880 [Rhizobium sp. 63-7]|nr:MAG: hypothetical protein BGN83_11880 [Rhizobium sp. 63-7]